MLLLVQYAGSLVICKGWRRPNTMDMDVERWARRLVWMPLRQKLSYHAFLLLHVTSTGHIKKASSNMHVCPRCLLILQQARSNIISQIYNSSTCFPSCMYEVVTAWTRAGIAAATKPSDGLPLSDECCRCSQIDPG